MARIGPTPHVTEHVTEQVAEQVLALLAAAQQPASRSFLQQAVGLKHREHFRAAYLEPLLAAGYLELTIPDKPRSPKQRYRLTKAGQQLLEDETGGK